MALDTPINRQLLINIFPDLARDANFKILSERTPIYNCIAWAMGYTDRWVDPSIVDNIPWLWWPHGAERSYRPEALISAFEAEGFEISDNSKVEEGYSKVVLYKNQNTGKWTHAARIITSDVEHSKFGKAWDGQHSHNVLCHTAKGQEIQSYGIAYAYMKKSITTTPSTPVFSANISIDKNKLAQLKAMLSK